MAPTAVVAAIVFLIAALFFLTFFGRRSHRPSSTTSTLPIVDHRPILFTPSNSLGGLDVDVIDTFPTFDYSHVSLENRALECYVCLNEFEPHETLRLIPACDHAFHVGCIDAWLACNATCPVCRADLRLSNHELTQIDEDDVVVINVTDPPMVRNMSSGIPRLARLMSTGRVSIKERFTLRVSEEVRRRIVSGKLRRSMSSGGEGKHGRRGRWLFMRSKSMPEALEDNVHAALA